MHKNTAIWIERLGKTNISDLRKLFFSVYQRKTAEDFFQKKYNTAYTGVQYLGYIAYIENRVPVAFYGVIPCHLCCNGDILLAAQSADTMTHPVFRNKGLFVKLAEMTVVLCKDHHVQVLFGFPNQHSIPGFINKLGWKTVIQMECFSIPVYPRRGRKLIRKLSEWTNVCRRYQQKIISKYAYSVSGKPYSFFANRDPGVYKSEAYILYKEYNDHWFVTLPNAFVWIKISDQLVIGDLLAEEKDFDAVLETLGMIAAGLGLNKIIFHCTKNTPLHALFARRCIAIRSFPVIFKAIGEITELTNYSFTYADIDTF